MRIIKSLMATFALASVLGVIACNDDDGSDDTTTAEGGAAGAAAGGAAVTTSARPAPASQGSVGGVSDGGGTAAAVAIRAGRYSPAAAERARKRAARRPRAARADAPPRGFPAPAALPLLGAGAGWRRRRRVFLRAAALAPRRAV